MDVIFRSEQCPISGLGRVAAAPRLIGARR